MGVQVEYANNMNEKYGATMPSEHVYSIVSTHIGNFGKKPGLTQSTHYVKDKH